MNNDHLTTVHIVISQGGQGPGDATILGSQAPQASVAALLIEECPFSQRQVEMIQWLANGKTASEIGEILGLSLWTVQKYLDRAKQAAGVRKDTALVATALRNGWIA
jgi:LuxR family transcriptional regulator, transcriptional regulator of spore coat protein